MKASTCWPKFAAENLSGPNQNHKCLALMTLHDNNEKIVDREQMY